MTIYEYGPIQCSCHRILKDLYYAQGKPRTAQAFLCCGPGDVTVDIINVHAPWGKVKLTDQQRKTLLRNLLQSDSQSMLGQAIGSARFLIGGDMNTGPFLLSQNGYKPVATRVRYTHRNISMNPYLVQREIFVFSEGSTQRP